MKCADSLLQQGQVIERQAGNFAKWPENSHRALAFGHINTNSVHLKYLLIDNIHGDRFYALTV